MSLYQNVISNDDDRGRMGRYSRVRSNRNGVISPGYDKSTPFSVALNSNNNNNNNNGDSGNHMTESRISSYSSRDPISTRQGGRAGAGPRKKSALVQSMAANFEQKKASPGPVTSSLTKVSLNGVESTSSSSTSKRNTLTVEDEEETAEAPARQKSGLSARRGKIQREKRMLRQKRRSTGVVRLQGSDDENEKDTKENKETKETTDENTLHITETEKNTVTNELSPPASGNNRPFAAEYLVPTPSIQLNSVKQSSYSSSAALRSTTSYQGTNDSSSVFPEAESSTKQQTSEMPNLNSSRRRGNRLSNDKMQQDEKGLVDDLKDKLSISENTIFKLRREIEAMDNDLRCLEEENQRLKGENKMLEDENLTMLRLIKR